MAKLIERTTMRAIPRPSCSRFEARKVREQNRLAFLWDFSLRSSPLLSKVDAEDEEDFPGSRAVVCIIAEKPEWLD